MIANLLAALLSVAAPPDGASPSKPVTYKMQLVWMAGTHPPEFVFVVGAVGFRSLPEFREFVGRLPKGSTLEWDPGCKRMGGEPLLSSREDMEAFRALCKEKGIEFVLVPSG